MIGKKYLIAIAICFIVSALPHATFAETPEETSLKNQLMQSLNEQLKLLRAQLAEIQNVRQSSTTEEIAVKLKSTNGIFKKIRNPNGPNNTGEGKYILQVDITAGKSDLYIPVSITTGRKSYGLIYQIEGSERATSTATVTCNGEDSFIVTSGSISYCKVPAGKIVGFKVSVTIVGPLREEYRVALGRINYKLNPNDTRYKKFLTDIHTKLLKFR